MSDCFRDRAVEYELLPQVSEPILSLGGREQVLSGMLHFSDAHVLQHELLCIYLVLLVFM